MFYENVRNKFAKDVGFNYKRSFEDRSLRPGQMRQHNDYGRRDKYDDRRIEHHNNRGQGGWDNSNKDFRSGNKRTYNEYNHGKNGRDVIDFHEGGGGS